MVRVARRRPNPTLPPPVPREGAPGSKTPDVLEKVLPDPEVSNSRAPSAPSYPVHDEYLRVPMRDGVTLHARLWRPDADEPLPVVFNHDPYRSSDMRTLGRGNIFHWLARHGFVAVHLSVRGTDASEGIAADEYCEAEMRDGYDAVEWFAA